MLASNLGWVFDGFETFALILTVGVALRPLVPAWGLNVDASRPGLFKAAADFLRPTR